MKSSMLNLHQATSATCSDTTTSGLSTCPKSKAGSRAAAVYVKRGHDSRCQKIALTTSTRLCSSRLDLHLASTSSINHGYAKGKGDEKEEAKGSHLKGHKPDFNKEMFFGSVGLLSHSLLVDLTKISVLFA
jgi:hypothetical protein